MLYVKLKSANHASNNFTSSKKKNYNVKQDFESMVITVKGTSSAITILTSTSTIESKKKAFTLLFFKEEYFIKQTLFLILVLSCFQVLMILLTNSMVINCNSNRY